MYKCSVFDSIPYNIIYTRNLGNDIRLQPTINERVNYTYDINEQDDKKIAEQVRAEDKAIVEIRNFYINKIKIQDIIIHEDYRFHLEIFF